MSMIHKNHNIQMKGLIIPMQCSTPLNILIVTPGSTSYVEWKPSSCAHRLWILGCYERFILELGREDKLLLLRQKTELQDKVIMDRSKHILSSWSNLFMTSYLEHMQMEILYLDTKEHRDLQCISRGPWASTYIPPGHSRHGFICYDELS